MLLFHSTCYLMQMIKTNVSLYAVIINHCTYFQTAMYNHFNTSEISDRSFYLAIALSKTNQTPMFSYCALPSLKNFEKVTNFARTSQGLLP